MIECVIAVEQKNTEKSGAIGNMLDKYVDPNMFNKICSHDTAGEKRHKV